jgi:signal transduction histidine kinase
MAAARLLLSVFHDQLRDRDQRQRLENAEAAISSSMRRLRTLVFDVRPPELDDDGVGVALRRYLTESARQGGFQAELRDDLQQEPPAEARVIAYRIAQEALTNVRVHARATRVDVRLGEARDGLLVTVAETTASASSRTGSRLIPGPGTSA